MKTIKITALLIICLFSYSLFAQTKYLLKCDTKLLLLSKQIGIKQIGVCEISNNNDGQFIKDYVKSVALAQGNPYCAAGQYYCFAEAAKILKYNNSFIPIFKTGLANKIFDDAKIKGSYSKYYPNDNDLIIWRNNNTCFGHIERIIKVYKAGWVTTLAFNVSIIKNGKKIEGVFLKKRNIYHHIGRLCIRGIIGFNN